TGEVSRAERERLRSGLTEQTGRLAQAFDDELRDSCRAVIPAAADLRDKGIPEAHRSRYQGWAASHDASVFARIGIAVPEGDTLKLYGIDGQGRMTPMQWPANWESLRVAMTGRMRGAGPPSVPPNSTLIEFPVFDNSGARDNPRPEVEWMIFEVSQEHLENKTLPRLIKQYLGGAESAYDVSVSWADASRSIIFSTRADKSSVAVGADLATGIFSTDNAGLADRFQRRTGRAGARARWTLAVRHREGSLDAAVARARTRNSLTSFVLVGVLGAAAWALVRYTARSRRLAEMQFRFAAGVSHDLRTPLTAIRGAAFNLADGLVTEPAGIKRYAKLILRNAEELTSMIENVLAFSASLHSRREERGETFAVGDLLKHAAAALAQESEQAGCQVELSVAPDLPPVAGDPVALELAFRNLIGNAARHAGQGKWIGISAERCADGVEVRVSDRGDGIPEMERERIFEPFYRGEQALTAQVRGTGLGLSLVKDTVKLHHGTITVQNLPTGGAQFTVRLPAINGIG
ncbi:MAG: HAMP domain-containing histidine kinase, partial [Acidobacteriota bacterium]|nr:HAMP domain-containing histidine kinase [Acidobacteriota bacterium]